MLCFLLLGPEHADPLEFWWGPMSPWLALAIAIIVTGGLAILLRLRLLGIAIGFWVTFVASIAVLAASGHAMTARWHLGPVSDWYFWQVLAFSPEILVFLFFMITDPKTIPSGRTGRRVYAVAIGLLAALLAAPQTTEFATKVAVLSALFIVCAARPLIIIFLDLARARGLSWLGSVLSSHGGRRWVRPRSSARWRSRAARRRRRPGPFERGRHDSVRRRRRTSSSPSRSSRRRAGADRPPHGAGDRAGCAADLQIESDALRRRDLDRATEGADGDRLAALWRQIGLRRGARSSCRTTIVERTSVTLEPGDGQSPPTVVATLGGTVERATYSGSPPTVVRRGAPARFSRAFELTLANGRYLIVAARGRRRHRPRPPPIRSEAFGGVHLQDVAAQVGLDFTQGAFHFGVTDEPEAMMGGGLCWIDYDDDGWLDLFVVNAYADDEYDRWTESGGLPRSALFHNVHGPIRGREPRLAERTCSSAAAAASTGDFNLDGKADLYVTTAGYNVATNGYDALLWGHGDGTFTEGAACGRDQRPGLALRRRGRGRERRRASGSVRGRVRRHQRPDPVLDRRLPGQPRRRARPPLPEPGRTRRAAPASARSGKRAGLEATHLDHGLGAVFTDVNADGRLDLYVANDLDPNRLYLNVARPGELGFRFEERARQEGIADPNAGMGIAAADYSLDGREDLFVTNSRRQLHAIYRSAAPKGGEVSFTDARPDFVAALGKSYTGWGVSWADLDLDGNLDLVLANGAIPVVNLKKDAQRIQVLQNLTGEGRSGEFADAGSIVGPTRRSAQQRPRPGRSRLRQRRGPRRRDQLDRRAD